MLSLGEIAKEVHLRIDQDEDSKTPALTRSGVFEMTKAIFDICGQALAAGEEVSVPKFGKFAVSIRKARKGRNPHTGKAIDIDAKASVKFRPSSVLKLAVGEIDVKKLEKELNKEKTKKVSKKGKKKAGKKKSKKK